MAKKRKDLSGQLDGLFADLDSEELEAQGEQEREQAEPASTEPALTEEPQAIDELIEGEPAEQAQPAAERVQPEEPIQVEPIELSAEAPAIDGLLSAEPEEVAVEPEPAALEPAAEPEPQAIGLPTMAQLMADLEAAEEEEAITTEEAAPEPVTEVEPEMFEPAVGEMAGGPAAPEAEREGAEPVPSSAPFAWEVTIKEQRTRILNVLLGFVTAAATVVIGSLVVLSLNRPELWLGYIPYFIAWVALLVLTFVRRIDLVWRTVGLVVLAYAVGIQSLYLDGPLGAGWLYLLLAPLLLSTLVGRHAGIYAAVASFCVYLAFASAHYLGWLVPVDVLAREKWTWTTVLLNMSGSFGLVLTAATMIQWMFNSSLITSLREAQERHAEALHSQALLEQRAGELSTAITMLQRRSLQLETASQVSSAASSELDPGELIQQVVDLIQKRFGLYYVGLFLTAEGGAGNGAGADLQEVVLKAGTGVAGRWMLSRGYSVEIGGDSPVGQCTARGQAQIAEVDGGGLDFASDLLPQTRSEVALPLRSRGRVLGVLDVHSTHPEAFSQEDVAVLQTMSDQIAVTIDNAQLFAELRQRLREMEASQRLYVREQWTDLTSRRFSPFHERAQPQAAPLTDAVLSEAEEAALRQEMVVRSGDGGEAGEATLVTPISLRGQIIGALGLQESEGGRRWTEDEITLIEAVADQMALAIENVRLLEETRQLAGWEQTLSDMTARFTQSLDTQTLLQAAVQELGQLLQVDEVSVHIGVPGEPGLIEDEETV